MAFTFFGQTPSTTTTVSASPTPTTTVFTVASITNFVEGQYITVEISGNDERCQIQSIAGSQITLTSPLSGVPTVPGSVKSGRELLTNSKLSHGWVGIAASISDLASTSLANAVSYLKAHLPGYGMYMNNPDATYPNDTEMAVTNGSKQWTLDLPGFDLIEAYVQSLLTPLQEEVEELRDEVNVLKSLSANILEVYPFRLQVTLPAITASSELEVKIPIVPYYLSETRITDHLILTGFTLPSGIDVIDHYLDSYNALFRIRNLTAGTITPGNAELKFKIERERV